MRFYGFTYINFSISKDSSRAPELMYPKPKPEKVVVLRNRETPVMCFFSGYGTPTMSWKGKNGGSLPPGWLTRDDGTTLVVKNPTYEQSGSYRCEGSNSMAITTENINIDVQCKLYLIYTLV